MEQYEVEELDRARVLSNGQVLRFVAGFWLRHPVLLTMAAGLMLVAGAFVLMVPRAA